MNKKSNGFRGSTHTAMPSRESNTTEANGNLLPHKKKKTLKIESKDYGNSKEDKELK